MGDRGQKLKYIIYIMYIGIPQFICAFSSDYEMELTTTKKTMAAVVIREACRHCVKK